MFFLRQGPPFAGFSVQIKYSFSQCFRFPNNQLFYPNEHELNNLYEHLLSFQQRIKIPKSSPLPFLREIDFKST